MPSQQRYLTAREAADMLGINVATLYAYVSRGLLRSEPGDGSTRARRYLVEDIEALQARKEYRREPAKAAESALGYGMPVLDSSITLIDDGRLYYRGHDVLALARVRSFEEVAALLWTGDFALDKLFPAEPALVSTLPLPGDPDNPIEHYQATLALTATHDLAAHRTRHTQSPKRVYASCPCSRAPPPVTLYRTRWQSRCNRRGRPAMPSAAALLSAALILCADHELNVSAFTARCVASAGSTPYAVVIAALSALQGYKHGGHTAQAAALLAAAAQGVRPALAAYLKGGDKIPGFGHPLYPDGDPRGQCLLAMLNDRYAASPSVSVANDLCAAVYSILGRRPTIDFALATLGAAIGAPRHSPLAIFALGRTAGWIGHAIEQYALDQLIRPRARYVGPMPHQPA